MAAAKASSNKKPSKTQAKGGKLSTLKSLLLGKEKSKAKNTSEKGADKARAAKGKPAPAIAKGKGGKAAPKVAAPKSASPVVTKKGAAPVKGKTAAAPALAKGKVAAPAPTPAKGKAIAAPVQAPAPAVSAKVAAQPRGMRPAAPAAKGKSAGASVSRGRGRSDEQCCREVACEGLASTGGYCRLHYIKNWKKIKRKELILKEGKLIQYIEELVAKYPDKYIEAIRQDLAHDKDFAKVIYDLDLDEGVDEFDVDGENVENIIDTIKRDFEDEGEGF